MEKITILDLSGLTNCIISDISLTEKKSGHLKYYDKFFYRGHSISYIVEIDGNVTIYEHDCLGNDQWSYSGRKIGSFRLPDWMM